MAYELKVPATGESITEVEIGTWLKNEGEAIRRDEAVVELVTDKATLELPSPVAGRLAKILLPTGSRAQVGQVVALIGEGAVESAPPPQTHPAPEPQPQAQAPVAMPAAERLMAERGISASQVEGTGRGGRILKEDVERALEQQAPPVQAPPPAPAAPQPRPEPPRPTGERRDEVVPMSPLRRRIAERLVQAQQTAAMLTTFNEVDMSQVIELRRTFGELFQKRHGIRLGFMSFFVKATVEALREFPALNAEIQGDKIVYHRYYDLGIAVGGGEALVVPVLRNADQLSFAAIEQGIADLAERVKTKKIRPEELVGATFGITNAGVYGSTHGTPLLSPPNVGVLGTYAIVERPVVRDGQVVVRPIMTLALTYDHRIIDGREAGLFLSRVRELLEQPIRLLLEI
jgi:2-oxoglutarate dehydrogenase E2 component (dihydrolipoamide succinyltransferase)